MCRISSMLALGMQCSRAHSTPKSHIPLNQYSFLNTEKITYALQQRYDIKQKHVSLTSVFIFHHDVIFKYCKRLIKDINRFIKLKASLFLPTKFIHFDSFFKNSLFGIICF